MMLNGITKNQCPIQFYGRAGGTVPLPEEVLKQIQLMVNDGIPADVDPRDLWFERLTAELGLTYEDLEGEKNDAIQEQVIYQRPEALTDLQTTYCPGCTHGVAHRLIAEVIDEMGIRDTTIGVAPVGCSVFAYRFFDVDFVEASHGRAPAMATGIKRSLPDELRLYLSG